MGAEKVSQMQWEKWKWWGRRRKIQDGLPFVRVMIARADGDNVASWGPPMPSNDFPMGTIYNLISASLSAHGKENHAQTLKSEAGSAAECTERNRAEPEHSLLSHLWPNGAAITLR